MRFPEKIYFDMDGVLADFDCGVIEFCGLPAPPPGKGWSIIGDDVMWAKVREIPHFYDRLEPMPGAKEMFDLVYDRFGERCEILSAVPRPERGIVGAKEDKIRWMRRHFPEQIVVNIVLRKEKPLFCKGKGSILIDDFSDNIRKWEKNGGTGICHKSPAETLAALRKMELL